MHLFKVIVPILVDFSRRIILSSSGYSNLCAVHILSNEPQRKTPHKIKFAEYPIKFSLPKPAAAQENFRFENHYITSLLGRIKPSEYYSIVNNNNFDKKQDASVACNVALGIHINSFSSQIINFKSSDLWTAILNLSLKSSIFWTAILNLLLKSSIL